MADEGGLTADIILEHDTDGCYVEVGGYKDGDIYFYAEGDEEMPATMRLAPRQAHEVMCALAAQLANY